MTYSDIAAYRKRFHQHPEISGQESWTSSKVLEILEQFSPTKITSSIGGYGIIAEYDSGNPGKTRLFRAELDALPIHEINTFEHRSLIDGKGHKCGHDGHLSCLLGLAKTLQNDPPKTGKVLLLFQPAEENGEGAKAMLADDAFNSFKPDFVVAYHNLPGYPLGQIVTKKGSFTASVISIIYRLDGISAHAAEPEHGTNPSLAISKILQQALHLEKNDIQHPSFNVITPIHITVGNKDYGISAHSGELHLTVRTWTQEELDHLIQQLNELAQKKAIEHNLELTIQYTQHFHANKCDDQVVELVQKATSDLDYNQTERTYPFKWGEDFGLFTQQFPGAMFGIGSGEECPALHNPDYDFPDELIPIASTLFHQIVKNTELK